MSIESVTNYHCQQYGPPRQEDPVIEEFLNQYPNQECIVQLIRLAKQAAKRNTTLEEKSKWALGIYNKIRFPEEQEDQSIKKEIGQQSIPSLIAALLGLYNGECYQPLFAINYNTAYRNNPETLLPADTTIFEEDMETEEGAPTVKGRMTEIEEDAVIVEGSMAETGEDAAIVQRMTEIADGDNQKNLPKTDLEIERAAAIREIADVDNRKNLSRISCLDLDSFVQSAKYLSRQFASSLKAKDPVPFFLRVWAAPSIMWENHSSQLRIALLKEALLRVFSKDKDKALYEAYIELFPIFSNLFDQAEAKGIYSKALLSGSSSCAIL